MCQKQIHFKNCLSSTLVRLLTLATRFLLLCQLSVVLLNKCGCVCPDRKWVAYSKLYQSLEVDSSVLLQQLTSIEYHWHQQELPYQQV